jgi:hypothetical protein
MYRNASPVCWPAWIEMHLISKFFAEQLFDFLLLSRKFSDHEQGTTTTGLSMFGKHFRLGCMTECDKPYGHGFNRPMTSGLPMTVKASGFLKSRNRFFDIENVGSSVPKMMFTKMIYLFKLFAEMKKLKLTWTRYAIWLILLRWVYDPFRLSHLIRGIYLNQNHDFTVESPSISGWPW